MTIKLSIIIVTYNPGDILLDCLHSLSEGVGNNSSEVIVIDNASQDNTPERIAHDFPHILLIANTDNRGFAAGNNQGLARAEGEYLVLLNPDVIVKKDALAQMIAYLDQHPEVGIVGPRTFDRDGRVALSARIPIGVSDTLWQYWGLSRLFPNWMSGYYRIACQQANVPFDVGWVQGSCLMFRRDVYEQVGELDEHFFLFAEEADFCARTIEAGWRIRYLPSAHIIHFESSSVSRYPLVKIRSHHLSLLYYFRKRKRTKAVVALKLGFTLELLSKAIIRIAQIPLQRDMSRRAEILRRIQAYWIVFGESWRY